MIDHVKTCSRSGLSVDVLFGNPKPLFGDLFLICGDKHPKLKASGRYLFDSLVDLRFRQVDDYYGILTCNNKGDDVSIWLYPLVDGNVVCHHPGPYDAIRLNYNILRNPTTCIDHYVECVKRFSVFGVRVVYRVRAIELEMPADLSVLREDANEVVQYWISKGITPGSNEALELNS